MTDNEKAARKKKIMHAVMWVVLLLLFLCFVAPFILVVINVFKTKADITSNPLALIGKHGFTMKNFPEAMKKMNSQRWSLPWSFRSRSSWFPSYPYTAEHSAS